MSYPILFSAEDPDAGLQSAIAGVAVAGKSVVGKVVEAWEAQGLGVLSSAVKCRVYEEINGQYELTLEYPKNGMHYDEIGKDSIILVDVPREEKKQAFRVYEIEKTLRGTTEFTARHISYDLTGYPVKASSVVKTGIVNALNSLVTDAVVLPPFMFTTDKTNTTTQFRVTATGSIRSWLGGREGSILDKFGGEWHWNNYTCELLNRRGSDNGYTIRYAKNLTSLRNVLNNEKTYTGVVCVYTDADGNTVASDVQPTGVGQLVNILSVDVTAEYANIPSKASLNQRAQSYITSAGLNSLDETSITLSFIDNPDAVASVGLGDTVTIQCEDLNFSSRVIKSTWDVLLGRYVELTVGKVVATLSDTIHAIENTADLTDTRNVLKIDSEGNVVNRPLNADADMTEEEWQHYKGFDRVSLFANNQAQLTGRNSMIAKAEGIPTYRQVGDTVRTEYWRQASLSLISSLQRTIGLLSSDRKSTDQRTWFVVNFSDIDIRGGVTHDLETYDVPVYYDDYVDLNLYGDARIKKMPNPSVVGGEHGNFTVEGDLTVGGSIIGAIANGFTYGGSLNSAAMIRIICPVSWYGIIYMYGTNDDMAMYMVRNTANGVAYIHPILNSETLWVDIPSGYTSQIRLHNGGSEVMQWYYIGSDDIKRRP